MKQDQFKDLVAFALVARERSFTRAAAQLDMSASALSHAMKALEGRLGVRLLARTTRSVAATDAGERLLNAVRPAIEDIRQALAALSEMRDKPAGTLRITALKHAASSVLLPILPTFQAAYPDVQVEITVDDALTDIVAANYDAGLRFGDLVDKDMIAMRVGADLPIAVVGSPEYFAAHPPPHTPRDLAEHQCINYRLARAGSIYPWEFLRHGRPLRIKVNGPLVFNDGDLILHAALSGLGIACAFEDQVASHIAEGRLVRVLTSWCAVFPGYHLYYPNRKQTSSALAVFVETLRSSSVAARKERKSKS